MCPWSKYFESLHTDLINACLEYACEEHFYSSCRDKEIGAQSFYLSYWMWHRKTTEELKTEYRFQDYQASFYTLKQRKHLQEKHEFIPMLLIIHT